VSYIRAEAAGQANLDIFAEGSVMERAEEHPVPADRLGPAPCANLNATSSRLPGASA
jgi:hypothetical protein